MWALPLISCCDPEEVTLPLLFGLHIAHLKDEDITLYHNYKDDIPGRGKSRCKELETNDCLSLTTVAGHINGPNLSPLPRPSLLRVGVMTLPLHSELSPVIWPIGMIADMAQANT